MCHPLLPVLASTRPLGSAGTDAVASRKASGTLFPSAAKVTSIAVGTPAFPHSLYSGLHTKDPGYSELADMDDLTKVTCPLVIVHSYYGSLHTLVPRR